MNMLPLQEERMNDSLVKRPLLLARSPGVELLRGLEALPAADEIDLVCLARSLSLPRVPDDVEHDDDGESKVRQEKDLCGFGTTGASADWPDSDVLRKDTVSFTLASANLVTYELSDQHLLYGK